MLDSLWIMLGVFVVVMAALVYVLVRFRHRKGYNDEVPQVHGSTKLELLWTIIPAILLIIIAVPTVEQSFVLGAVQPPKDRPIDVQVVGHQFWFQFDYTRYHIDTADEMHVPVDRKINLSMTSADVMHSFWVPALAGKTDLIPGKITTLWFEATRPGIYTGQCAEYCGYGHADMHIIVKAESAAAFQRWVHRMHHPVSTPQTALARQGMTIFAEVGCSACHTIAGTQFQGTIGPNLTDLANRPIIAGGALPNTAPAMREWLRNPPGVVPGSLMPNLHLSSSQIDALTAYLRGLK